MNGAFHLFQGDRGSARPSSFVVAVAIVALAVTACTPAAGPAPSTPTAVTATGPAATPAARAGGTITIDLDLPVRNIDPVKNTVTAERIAMEQVLERLLSRDANNQLQPALATSWRTEPGGLSWIVELRRGVKFTDGTPFNAAAVLENFARWMDEKNTGRNMREMRLVYKSAEAVNDLTVKLHTKAVVPHAMAHLSTWGAEIISPVQLQRAGRFGDEMDKNPIGTGPFKVESFVSGERLTLVRNDDYWGDKSLLDKVIFRNIADASARTAALVSSQTTFALNVPVTQVQALRGAQGIQVIEFPSLFQQWFEFNVKRPPLDKPQVRIALNHAIDMEAVKSIVFEGLTVPFSGPINPTVFKPDPPVEGFKHDPQLAKSLLQQAGASNLKLQFVYHEAVPTRYAELLQSQLRQAGVELELIRVDRPRSDAMRVAGQFDIAYNAHGNGLRVAPSILSGTVHSKGFASVNTGYKNANIDRLVDAALFELDDKKRSDQLTELFREFMKDPPFIATRGGVSVHAFSSKLKGFVPPFHPDLEMPLNKMWLDN